jgi:hypothetical protein
LVYIISEILASKKSNNCLHTNLLETNNLLNKELKIKPIKEAVIIKMKNNLLKI